MQGGRLLVDAKQSAKPRGGQARFVVRLDGGPALLLTEQGTERRAGVWCVDRGDRADVAAARQARPRGGHDRARRAARPASRREVDAAPRVPPRPAAASPGSAGGSPTRCCHRAKLSPFAMTGKLGPPTTPPPSSTAIREAVAEGLEYERTRDDMSSSKDRPGRRPRPRRRAVPGVRRHDPRRRVLGLHRQLLPDVPDRRQGARRQHDEQVPQVARCRGHDAGRRRRRHRRWRAGAAADSRDAAPPLRVGVGHHQRVARSAAA